MAFKQRTIDERLHQQLERFLRAARERSFFSSPNRKELEAHLAAWLPKMHAARLWGFAGAKRGCRLGAVERQGILLMRRWRALLERPIARAALRRPWRR